MDNEIYFWHADKHWSFFQVDTMILGVNSQTCPKYPKQEVYISLQYLQKSVEDEVYVLPADKHKGLVQVDDITLGVGSRAYLKYPK